MILDGTVGPIYTNASRDIVPPLAARENAMTYTVKLYNSSNGELDSKSGNDLGDILRQYADEGCLSGGDTIRIVDNDEECWRCGGTGIEPCAVTFDCGDGEGEDSPCSVCSGG